MYRTSCSGQTATEDSASALERAPRLFSGREPAEPPISSSDLGNGSGQRWDPGRHHQAGYAPEGAIKDHSDGPHGTRRKEVEAR